MRPLLAKLLIMKRKAEEVYIINELCYGEMSYVQDYEIKELRGDEISDISFYLVPLSIAILKYEPAKFYDGVVGLYDYYTLVASGKRYLSNRNYNNKRIDERDIIVNASTVHKLTDMGRELKSRGLTPNTYLSKREIAMLQEELDEKYNLYRGITRYEP